MISWQTAKTLLFTLGPLIIPRLISYYRTARAQAQTSPQPIRPVPTHVQHSINILFFAALIAVISTYPYFAPENIFDLTSSRFQTPTEVLFTRLRSLRPNNTLFKTDENLRNKLISQDARCLYLTYGPRTMADCLFCSSDDPASYFYYSVPSILTIHVANIFALGLATSSAIAEREGSRWRTLAVLSAVVGALADLGMFHNFDWRTNARSTSANEMVPFYWNMRIFRGVGIALLDAGVAGLLYLSSTNRMFVAQKDEAERLEEIARRLDSVRGKLTTIGVVRNVTVRQENLRRKIEGYWRREAEDTREVMSEREVVDGMNAALTSGRLNVAALEEEAGRYVEGITKSGFGDI